MVIKRNLFFLFSITLFAVASTVLDLFNYNPFTSNIGIFINFYISLTLAITGILGLLIFYIRISRHKNLSNTYFWPSVRLAFFISLGVNTLLFLKGMKLLDIWVGIPLMIAIILLELFFQTNKTKKVDI